MTAQELAQRILDIAQKALAKPTAIYIGDDDPGLDARSGLEAIIKLCQEVPKDQPVPVGEAYKQYEKKVSHAKNS